jgi:hypothetical protein
MADSDFDLGVLLNDNPTDQDMQSFVTYMIEGHYIEHKWSSPTIDCTYAILGTDDDHLDQGIKACVVFDHGTPNTSAMATRTHFPLDLTGCKEAMQWIREKTQHVIARGVCTSCLTNPREPQCAVRLHGTANCGQCFLSKLLFPTHQIVPETQQALPSQLSSKLIDRIGNLSTDLVGEYTDPYSLTVLEDMLLHMSFMGGFKIKGASPKFPRIVINIYTKPRTSSFFDMTIHFSLAATGNTTSLCYLKCYQRKTSGIKTALEFLCNTLNAAELRGVCSECIALDEPFKHMCLLRTKFCHLHQ